MAKSANCYQLWQDIEKFLKLTSEHQLLTIPSKKEPKNSGLHTGEIPLVSPQCLVLNYFF